MLEATAQKSINAHKAHREMRSSLEALTKLISPAINAYGLAESLHLQRIRSGADFDWTHEQQRQTILVGAETRSGERNTDTAPLSDHSAITVSLSCPVSQAIVARSYALENGAPCKNSRRVELNFAHNFVDLLRQKFLTQARSDVTAKTINELFKRQIATSGFECLSQVNIVQGYQAVGEFGICKAAEDTSLNDCMFFLLNLHIGIVGGTYGVHWSDSYCFSETGHLSIFGI